eukprot:EG_transcript_11361
MATFLFFYMKQLNQRLRGGSWIAASLSEIDDERVLLAPKAADQVIRRMYECINARDVEGALQYIDEKCVYEDLNFPTPFVGRDGVRRLFEECAESLPPDLLFCIDEITAGDGLAVGVVWHVELGGIPFPNGRGTSYYRIDPHSRLLVFARDCVEPALKPGQASFAIIRLVSPLLRRLLQPPRIADLPEATNSGPPLVRYIPAALYTAAAAYTYLLLLSPPDALVPGDPAWAIKPETLAEVLGESLNFFFVLPLINAVGIRPLEAPVVPPVSESIFNFAEAYIFMLLPLLLVDRRSRPRLPTVSVWVGAMFLTNVFLLPYLALRAATPPSAPPAPAAKGPLARPFGVVGALVGLLAVAWFFIGRPEVGGDLQARLEYLHMAVTTQRVSIAFCVDIVLFAVAQAVLIGAVEPEGSRKRWLRWVPFWGLAAWLIV